MKREFTLTRKFLVLVACTLFSWGLVYAEADSLAVNQSPFVKAVERAMPAVVNISAEKVVKVSRDEIFPDFGGPFDEFFREFFRGMPIPEQNIRSLGSGVIVSSEGYIVTNNHVIAGYEDIVVKLADGTVFKGDEVKVVGRDPQTDLAVLKVNSDKPLMAIKYADPASIKVGDWAIAIGNPFGLQGTVTVGVVSAIGRSGIPLPEGPTRQDFIQTDAAINPGNSGGALVNIRGELIGINTALSSPVGANVGVGFAVPVSYVKPVVEQLITYGKVIRGYLGVRPQVINEKIRQALKLDDTTGVLISEVVANTPAEKAGLKPGDVIVAINGESFAGVEGFRKLIAEFKPGTEVVLTVIRNGKRMTKRAVLTEFPEERAENIPTDVEKGKGWLGIKVSELSSDEKKAADVSDGVKVIGVERGSPADKAGIEVGDLILKVGDETIKGVDEFYRLTEKLSGAKEPLLLYIKRGSQPMFVAVEP
ncbi:Do family serine endopeptidase [candidate division WOR-3 bacterium]|nr:Do family serine endopeptidase [candidate division WOR-3 bacterium]